MKPVPDIPVTPEEEEVMDAVMQDAVNHGLGIMRDGNRIDPRDIFQPPSGQSAALPAAATAPADDIAHLIACTLAEMDGYDPDDQYGGLYDLRWSGGASPEPQGDAWSMDYLPKGEKIAAALAAPVAAQPVQDEQACRRAYDDFYHKIRADVGYDHWCAIWRFISKRQVALAAQPSATTPPVAAKACETDVCQAAKHDGVLCADDSCDLESGARTGTVAASSVGAKPVGEVILFGRDSDLKEVSWHQGKMPPQGTKLYANPAPAAPPAVDAVPVAWPVATTEQAAAVAYLDIGAGGYVDVGTDLTCKQLTALPKGRHMLGVIGTYGADGYVAAPVAAPPAVDAGPVGYFYQWELDRSKKAYPNGFPGAVPVFAVRRARLVQDMAMLIKRLLKSVPAWQRAEPLDFLRRHGLEGSPLREGEAE